MQVASRERGTKGNATQKNEREDCQDFGVRPPRFILTIHVEPI